MHPDLVAMIDGLRREGALPHHVLSELEKAGVPHPETALTAYLNHHDESGTPRAEMAPIDLPKP